MMKLNPTLRRLSLAGAFLLAALPASAALTGCTPSIVQVAGPNAEQHQIVVLGQSEISAVPDIARANLGIEVNAPTVGDATRQANERMNAIMAALKQMGIPEKDIHTSNFSVSFERLNNGPQPPYPGPYGGMVPYGLPQAAEAAPAGPALVAPLPPPAPRGKGGTAARPVASPVAPPAPPAPLPQPAVPAGFYRVSNTVEITLRELGRLGPALDAAMNAGANSIYGVSFSLDQTNAVTARAREEAVKDGRARAESLAKLGGVALGEVISIREDIGNDYHVPSPAMMMSARAAGGEATSIAPGEVKFSTQIRIVYALKPLEAR